MAPQQSIPTAANVLGTIGTILWCIQLIPQIWHNWRYKKTEGLPPAMMFLWALCSMPFGVYSVVQIQPHIFGCLALVTWAQILIYSGHWPAWRASLFAIFVAVVLGGIEVALVLTLRPIYIAGNGTPILVVGIIASVLITIGLLPPYFELAKRHGRVIGFNWLFLATDWTGGLFSLLALAVQETFDALGAVLFGLVMLFETGIFVSHAIWIWRGRPGLDDEEEQAIGGADGAAHRQSAGSEVTGHRPEVSEIGGGMTVHGGASRAVEVKEVV